ncbi:MAG: NUDIX domain-containing protein [Planctomycetes bacterium]|nr:NUDIX domain-containing protein [Planctomycetota bacterium]
MKLRNSAKAVLVHEGRVLLTRCVDHSGDWYCCPGGGQEPGETLAQAVARECVEETGAIVNVGDMLCVLEFHDHHNATHAIEFYFACTLEGGKIGMGNVPDSAQVAVEWIDPQKLKKIDMRPSDLVPVISELKGFKYLGDVSTRLQRVDPSDA